MQPRERTDGGAVPADLEDVVLVPAAPPRTPRPRVVGPGRKERAYLARAAELERALAERAAELERRAQELQLAALCERGAQRAADRLERAVDEQRAELARRAAGERRLLVALGALQRENELLRARLGKALGPRVLAALPERVATPLPPHSA
jgi:hypothetical protein